MRSMGKLLRCVSHEPSGPDLGSSSERAGHVTCTNRVSASIKRRANNTLWPQIIADVFQVPVRKPQDAEEAATRGAAYLALHMVRKQAGDTGTLAELLAEAVQLDDPTDPISEHAKPYQEMLETFEQTLNQLTPLYKQPWFNSNE